MRAIVTGVTGQDGYYMAKLLLEKGIAVLGLTSKAGTAELDLSGRHRDAFQIDTFDYCTPRRISMLVGSYRPDLIFNFASMATGEGMFDSPYELTRLNGGFVIDTLDALRESGRRHEITLCQASSSEMYGVVTETPQSETTPFRPRSPYGAAKVYAHNMIGIYRSVYGVRCCSAILYNHESIRRSAKFVTKKIAHAAAAISLGKMDFLTLGTLDAYRDWGYAPEYVEAMYRMAMADTPDDYVVASGRLNSVRTLCEIAFAHVGLDYSKYVRVSADKSRAIESVNLLGNPAKIRDALGWFASRTVEDIMAELVEHELSLTTGIR
jgi:GDPmannose 4,6-dehydratase